MTAIEQGFSIRHTNMANTLRTPEVRTVLDRLFAAAAQDDGRDQAYVAERRNRPLKRCVVTCLAQR